MPRRETYEFQGNTFALLSECRLGDKELALAQIRRHLATRFEDVYHIHPRKLEEIVCAIFSEQGFRVELRAFSHDGGIDLLVFRGQNDEPTAVQVKRHGRRRKVGIEELHQFIGAMTVQGIRSGIFVTTSSYTRGARILAHELRSAAEKIDLELRDASHLIDYLRSIPGRGAEGDPVDAAWELRTYAPHCDHFPRDEFSWAMSPPSAYEVDWWIGAHKRLALSNPADRSPALPVPLTDDRVRQLVRDLEKARYVEATFLDSASRYFRSIRVPSYKASGIERSFDLPIIDVREWRPPRNYRAVDDCSCSVGLALVRSQPARARNTEIARCATNEPAGPWRRWWRRFTRKS